jgi:hypothetical protein
MCSPYRRLPLGLSICLIFIFSGASHARANDVVLMSYGGHNEMIVPYWVAVDQGLYQKHGIDARLLQVRNAQISLTALISSEVPIFLPGHFALGAGGQARGRAHFSDHCGFAHRPANRRLMRPQRAYRQLAELMTRLAKGMVDGIVHILDPRNKKEATAVLKKHLS